MLRSLVCIFFLITTLPVCAQLSAYENESLQFVLDFKEGVVLVPIDRIEAGIKQNSVESSRKEESNLAIFNAFKSSGIAEYYFFYKENLEYIKKREFEGKLMGLSLQPVDIASLATREIFLISFLEPGHLSYPEVRTFKTTKSGFKADIREMESGSYPKLESQAYLRSIHSTYSKERYQGIESANARLNSLLDQGTQAWQQALNSENGVEQLNYRLPVDGDEFNRDFGRFLVMELRRLDAQRVELSKKKFAYCHPKYEARIYPELSQWVTMERAVAEIERQIDEQLEKYKKVIESRAKNKK